MMTFKDLKKLVELPSYKEQRVPTVKALEVSGVPVVTEKVLENHGSINVYQNGYVIYRAHKRVTVFSLRDCVHYKYDAAEGAGHHIEEGSISLEQVEEYEHQYQVAVQKQEAAFKKVMLAVNDIEKAFSHGNPWLMKFRAISIPETLERTHLKEWLDHVWIVDFEQVEVILQESEWKRFFPEEWLNNGEEDCNGKKE